MAKKKDKTEKDEKKEKKDKKEAKSSSFRGIRGVFGGGTKTKKKKKKSVRLDDDSELSTDTGSNALAAKPTDPTPPVEIEQEDEYEMQLQEFHRKAEAEKKAMPATSFAPQQQNDKKRPFQLILLLMAPDTRRFEFLQLEFDSQMATVRDILAQIPRSVTEHDIRRVAFRSVCDKDARERLPTTRLSEFCQRMDVLIGIPTELSAGNMYQLARPILSDDKVLTMLSRAGVNILPWQMTAKTESRSRDEPDIEFMPKQVEKRAPRASLPILPLLVVCCLVYFILKAGHEHYSSPIMVGVPVKPGTWRSKCGFMSIFPGCTNSFMEVNSDGTVNLFDSTPELAMKLKGNSCNGSPGCVDGLLLKKDGTILIGGKVVKSIVSYNKDMRITPWPFPTKPKAHIRHYAKKKQKAKAR